MCRSFVVWLDSYFNKFVSIYNIQIAVRFFNEVQKAVYVASSCQVCISGVCWFYVKARDGGTAGEAKRGEQHHLNDLSIGGYCMHHRR